MLKICVMGCVDFSARVLKQLYRLEDQGDCRIVGVVSRRASPENSDFCDLRSIWQDAEGSTPFHYYESQDKAVEFISGTGADILYCVGWSRLLNSAMLNSCPLGVVGYHPAALPANRGRHPIIWALALGLNETASTFFLMDKGADSGPILSQESVLIRADDDAATLYEKLTTVAMQQVEKITLGLGNGSIKAVEQDDRQANYWRKRSRRDGRIDWRMSAPMIHNLVRALRPPYPGADWCNKNGDEHKIWRASVAKEECPRNLEPGQVLAMEGDAILVACGDATALWVEEHDVPAKNYAVGGYLQ